MKITLIGLGTDENDLTLKGKQALDSAQKIMARTALTKSYNSLKGYNVEALDHIFTTSRSFETLNKKLANAVLNAAKNCEVVYCVDGAVSEDIACKIIAKRHKDCVVIEGVSKTAHAASLAKIQSTQICALSAYDIKNIKPSSATVVYDIDSAFIASEVKEVLSSLYGEESPCVFICANKAKKIKIYELDRLKNYDYSCSVAVEHNSFLTREKYDYCDLEEIIRILRAPGGCPWDRVQTVESIRKNIIEEAYELVDAINKKDADMIREESGDLLLQAAFVTVMMAETGEYSSMDVTTEVVKKLIFRHSHIFGKDKAESADSALSVWEKNKTVEKNQQTFGETVLAVPTAFPACMRAQKVQKRAAKSGFDFSSAEQAAQKINEELLELLSAIKSNNPANIEEEAGDLMFSVINTCRLAGVDCEQALSQSVEKFIKRFVACEELVIADGKDITKLTEEELDKYYIKAKNALKTN
ncbi:MAG: nucleoside triphosphate pyrophosphohydrolase [Clostridiales bacterium]|nr:nucleoside triphosphate pyrophosphohydrolase [Clostridiales bacterium]